MRYEARTIDHRRDAAIEVSTDGKCTRSIDHKVKRVRLLFVHSALVHMLMLEA